MTSTRYLAIIICTVLLWAPPVICFPAGIRDRSGAALSLVVVRRDVPATTVKKLLLPSSLLLQDHDNLDQYYYSFDRRNNDNIIHGDGSQGSKKVGDDYRYRHRDHIIFCAALLLCIGVVGMPSSCLALTTTTTTSRLSTIPTTSDLKSSLISILDGLSHSGTAGMAIYACSFTIWTMTMGITTPIETAAGMAFPLKQSIPLSAIGKIGGAIIQYTLAKYLFSDYARKKLEGNEWIVKINSSFQSNPYKVALIWRFSPLPEFVKNIGPALVPTLKTRYQMLATLTHGLPFTVLWSCIGNEAAMVARGGQASLFLKRAVAIISWVGLVVSPTLFGWWIKGLGVSNGNFDDMPSKTKIP